MGEGYAHDIMGDLNAGAAAWTDWNLLLDGKGGPNHLGNPCDAAMHTSQPVGTRLGLSENEYVDAPEEAGQWGGLCTCPDGQSYKVGDENNACGSLACVGGTPGPCQQRLLDKVYWHKKVTCANLKQELYMHPQYFFIGHFSKYILPGSRHLA